MILSNYKKFLDQIFSKLRGIGIDTSDLKLDHIAYKVSKVEEYDKLKPEFLKIGNLFRENLVGGRMVGIFKLFEPLEYNGNHFLAVELVSPKDGEICKTGLEHAEFILNESFDSLMGKYPNLSWDKSNVDRKQYPMLKLKLGEGIQVNFPKEGILEGE